MRKLILLTLFVLGCVRAQAAPLAPSKTDTLILNPLGSAPSCPSGSACLYALSADSQVYQVDAAGLVLKSHAAKSFRTAANCSALASPQNGDVCFDTSIPAFRFYSSGWSTATTNDSLVVHKAGTETVTGAKTFTTSVTLSAGATLGANLAGGGFKGTGFGQGTSVGELLTAGRQVLASAPLTGGGALTGDLTLGLSISSPLQVAGGSLSLASGSLVYAHLSAGAAGALGAATVYLVPPGGAPSATELRLAKATRAASARSLYCELGTAPGGADTVVFTLRAAAADTALTCTITGAATSCSDTLHLPSVTVAQSLAVKAVSSAGTAADALCSFELTN